MTCERARQALLEAGRSELEGQGDTPLARHVQGCERCRARSRAVLDDTEILDRSLAELSGTIEGPASPEVDDGAAARRAIAAARERKPEVTPRGPTPAETRPEHGASGESKKGWLRSAVPLAAAAVLALIYVVGEPPPPPGGWEAPDPEAPAATTPSAPSVEPGEGAGTVAVFETSDPDITVVWFFQEE